MSAASAGPLDRPDRSSPSGRPRTDDGRDRGCSTTARPPSSTWSTGHRGGAKDLGAGPVGGAIAPRAPLTAVAAREQAAGGRDGTVVAVPADRGPGERASWWRGDGR